MFRSGNERVLGDLEIESLNDAIEIRALDIAIVAQSQDTLSATESGNDLGRPASSAGWG